jgi:predicted RecB family nuclease
VLAEARAILDRSTTPKGASAAACKLCRWYNHCLEDLTRAGDLTLIPRLGRRARDTLNPSFSNLSELAAVNADAFLRGKNKTQFDGIGPNTLHKFIERARLLTDPQGRPYLTGVVTLPVAAVELFFDIEVDPMRDICYLHGIVERRGGDDASERFVAFFAETPTAHAEKTAFADAMSYFRAVQPAVIYYYSKYERTAYRKLQARFPEVCAAEEIEELFEPRRAIDLYNDIVTKLTEWPTNDHSIKTLAKYLGFEWRDTHPSGAASIEWFHRWTERNDPEIKQRILDYNEDDCRATRVLLDGIRGLQ